MEAGKEDQIFTRDGQPVLFVLHSSIKAPGTIAALLAQIYRHGGDALETDDGADIVLVNPRRLRSEKIAEYQRAYDDHPDERINRIWVKEMSFVQECIARGSMRLDFPQKRRMPGFPPGRRRTPFTSDDIDNLCRYLARKFPDPTGGRLSHKFYQEMVKLADYLPPTYHWVKRHTDQSWREFYKKHQSELDHKIADIVAESKPNPKAAYHRDRKFSKSLSPDEDDDEEMDDIADAEEDALVKQIADENDVFSPNTRDKGKRRAVVSDDDEEEDQNQSTSKATTSSSCPRPKVRRRQRSNENSPVHPENPAPSPTLVPVDSQEVVAEQEDPEQSRDVTQKSAASSSRPRPRPKSKPSAPRSKQAEDSAIRSEIFYPSSTLAPVDNYEREAMPPPVRVPLAPAPAEFLLDSSDANMGEVDQLDASGEVESQPVDNINHSGPQPGSPITEPIPQGGNSPPARNTRSRARSRSASVDPDPAPPLPMARRRAPRIRSQSVDIPPAVPVPAPAPAAAVGRNTRARARSRSASVSRQKGKGKGKAVVPAHRDGVAFALSPVQETLREGEGEEGETGKGSDHDSLFSDTESKNGPQQRQQQQQQDQRQRRDERMNEEENENVQADVDSEDDRQLQEIIIKSREAQDQAQGAGFTTPVKHGRGRARNQQPPSSGVSETSLSEEVPMEGTRASVERKKMVAKATYDDPFTPIPGTKAAGRVSRRA
ncbi:hypothetical protein D9757_012423 [Collybiopsis confluens]|uniref:BRCT domain-containing protein n=1 Tax=Collybiopsis confluens TaxID=2823264 RepID=A0A8H5CYG7_9AGAR|nr:hypothetical protein D9757_012423 [Collybiopsis confluens]